MSRRKILGRLEQQTEKRVLPKNTFVQREHFAVIAEILHSEAPDWFLFVQFKVFRSTLSNLKVSRCPAVWI